MAGSPVTFGRRLLLRFGPAHDSTLVARYRRAGLVFFGQTDTPEFGLVPFTETALYGPDPQPLGPRYTPGGSSGGAAAAVAAGSSRSPTPATAAARSASPPPCCGLFGLKPTRGRTPVRPRPGELWRGLAIDHVLSRSVRDSAALLDADDRARAGRRLRARPPRAPLPEEAARPRPAARRLHQAAHLAGAPPPRLRRRGGRCGRLLRTSATRSSEADLDVDADQPHPGLLHLRHRAAGGGDRAQRATARSAGARGAVQEQHLAHGDARPPADRARDALAGIACARPSARCAGCLTPTTSS